MSFIEYSSIIRDFVIDFTALYFFAYVILYRKFRNKELFVTCSLINVFMLLVIMALTRTSFNIAIGFGLFALLSMVQLRSTTFSKAEMAYLFGGVSLAVINGAGIPDLSFVLTCNFVIIGCAWIISSWSIEHSAAIIDVDSIKKMAVVLDEIDEEGLKDRAFMQRKLTNLFHLDVQSFEIKKIDYVKDVMELQIVYHVPEELAPETDAAGAPQSSVSEFPGRPAAAVGE
jgi:hypothetical protein